MGGERMGRDGECGVCIVLNENLGFVGVVSFASSSDAWREAKRGDDRAILRVGITAEVMNADVAVHIR